MRDASKLGENIRRLRKELGLTQSALAARLYVSPQNVSKWETGQSAPDVGNLCLLADTLGCTTDLLLGAQAVDRGGLMIGIDGGGTKTEFCLFDALGRVLARERLGGTNPNAYGMEQTKQTLKNGIDRLMGRENGICAIFAGIAGCGVESNRRAVTSFLKRTYAGVRVEVRNDAYNVVYSTDHFERCIMVIMGTGSAVFAKERGGFTRLGGWGYLFDNGFSGYAIGRDAVMAALAAEDRSGEPTVLFEMLTERLGGGVFESIPSLYRMPKEEIAALAKLVFEAYRAGDAVAGEILHTRAAQLRHLIERAASLYDVGTHVILAGGLTRDRDTVTELLDATHFTYEFPALPPIFGACKYCARMMGEPTEGFAEQFERSYANFTKE